MSYGKLNALIPIELSFVLSCTNFPELEEAKILLQNESNLNWNQVLYFAMVHQVFPLVYKALNAIESSVIPSYILKTLSQEYQKSAIKSINLTSETVRVSTRLQEKAILPIILKGSPLADKIYGDFTYRPSGDIDILVNPQDFAVAESVLTDLNYKRYSPDSRQEQIFLKNYKHFEYYNDRNRIVVELHWRAINPDVAEFTGISYLGSQKINLLGCQVNTLVNEEWLLYLMIHGCNHMWSQLRWLIDIKKFSCNYIDWDIIVSLAKKNDVIRMLHVTLYLLKVILQIPFPEPLEHDVMKDRKAKKLAILIINQLCRKEKNLINNKFIYLKNVILANCYNIGLRKGCKRKLAYLIRKLRPNTLDYDLINLPEKYTWLYYIIKPFSWIKRRLFNK